MGEHRDAARTRKKILDAAREEFAARGLTGARMEGIGRRAGLSKQLIYHYFPSKEALFDEILETKFQQHRSAMSQGEGPGAVFRQRFRTAVEDPVWMRLLIWEAAENAEGPVAADGPRREAIARQAETIGLRQAKGELPADLPAEFLQLAIYALATYPLAFARITEMVTGRSPEDPEFQAAWTAFLDEVGVRLARK